MFQFGFIALVELPPAIPREPLAFTSREFFDGFTKVRIRACELSRIRIRVTGGSTWNSLGGLEVINGLGNLHIKVFKSVHALKCIIDFKFDHLAS